MKPGHVRLLRELSDLLDTWQRYQPTDPDRLTPPARWEDDGLLRFPGGTARIDDTRTTWAFDSGAQMIETSPLQGDWSMRVTLADGTLIDAPAKVFGPRLCRPFSRALRAIARDEGKAQEDDTYTIARRGGLTVSAAFDGRTLRFDIAEPRDAKAPPSKPDAPGDAPAANTPPPRPARACRTAALAAAFFLLIAAAAAALIALAWRHLGV